MHAEKKNEQEKTRFCTSRRKMRLEIEPKKRRKDKSLFISSTKYVERLFITLQ